MDKKRLLTILIIFAAMQIAQFAMLVAVLGILIFRVPTVISGSSEEALGASTTPSPKKSLISKLFTATITPTPQAKVDNSLFPSQILDLTNWKLTIPDGSSEDPTEIKQPVLEKYKLDPWFVVQDGAVRFRAPVNAVTTSGSNYPRSELREMKDSGKTNASWSSTSGTHTMTIDEAILAVPKTKKHVVAGQIHDADDDIVVIRLEFPKLYVNVDGKNVFTLDSNYTLGKKFNVKFVVNNGQNQIFYNGSTDPVYTFTKDYSGAYFKAGAYTQSNCSKEASSDCNSNNYGEVIINQLKVTHE